MMHELCLCVPPPALAHVRAHQQVAKLTTSCAPVACSNQAAGRRLRTHRHLLQGSVKDPPAQRQRSADEMVAWRLSRGVATCCVGRVDGGRKAVAIASTATAMGSGQVDLLGGAPVLGRGADCRRNRPCGRRMAALVTDLRRTQRAPKMYPHHAAPKRDVRLACQTLPSAPCM